MSSKIVIQEGHSQHNLILVEAIRRGIQVKDLTSAHKTVTHQLTKGNRSFTLVQGIIQEWVNVNSEKICDHKNQTKRLFKSLEIPTPKSIVFENLDDPLGKLNQSSKYVCKPTVGTNGVGVQLGISSINDVSSYFKTYGHLGKLHLLEEFVDGYDLRIQVINSKIVAVCLRLAANVIGNGHDTLEALISRRQKEIKQQNPANDLQIDVQTNDLLKDQQVLLNDVIPLNKKIQLKTVANMAQGGHAIDVTNEIDPIYHLWVKSISKKLNIGYFALDLITEDHTNFKKGHTFALEINSRAEWMHHTFSEKRTHDLAKVILDALFQG